MFENRSRSLHVLIAIAMLGIVLVGCPPGDGGGEGPAANFIAQMRSGEAAFEVSFEDRSEPGTSAITSYAWDFGDGFPSLEETPTHISGIPSL